MKEVLSFDFPALDKVLEYTNEDVIFRFLKLYDISESDAEELFMDTKKWIYVIALNQKLYAEKKIDFTIGINDDLLILDEMWHNFILFTNDYSVFCENHFGTFIHHQPMTKNEHKNTIAQENIDFDKVQEERKVFYRKQFSFIYDLLGQETLIKWHKVWPIKYSVDNIKNIRK